MAQDRQQRRPAHLDRVDADPAARTGAARQPDSAPRALTIEEAAAAFDQPVSHIEAVARGRKLKGKETLAIPTRFTVETRQFVSPLGDRFLAVTRRELWGDGRLIWAIEHSPGAFETATEARAAFAPAGDAASTIGMRSPR